MGATNILMEKINLWLLGLASDSLGGGAPWLSGRTSDSRARGQGFNTYLRCVVSLSKTYYSPKVRVIRRKQCLRPNMTEKLLTGMLNLNANKTDSVSKT